MVTKNNYKITKLFSLYINLCICSFNYTVFVNCRVDTMTMTVCYHQHIGVDFKRGSRIYTNNHGEDVKCQGRLDSQCGEGGYLLKLKLKENECGMKKILMMDSIKYSSKIYVQKSSIASVNDIIFDTFCEFITQVRSNFQAVGVEEYDFF